MQPTYPTHLPSIGQFARRTRPMSRRPRRRPLHSLPRWIHAVPYAALALLGAVLLVPGVVPHGPWCGHDAGVASSAERELFIHLSAAAFGLIAGLLLLSGIVASAQRRGGRPGIPTLAAAALMGAVAVAAVISPHAPIAVPVQVLMYIVVGGLVGTIGGALVVPIAAVAIASGTMRGPCQLRAAQIGAWVVLLVVLPVIMAATYLTVTPICLD
jgi:hypothetical protein